MSKADAGKEVVAFVPLRQLRILREPKPASSRPMFKGYYTVVDPRWVIH